jgi:hypothetical protein
MQSFISKHQSPRRFQMSNNTQSKPNLGMQYLYGLAIYLWFRLLAAGETIIRLLLAPQRWVWAQLHKLWLRLKPWLVRHKRRLIWTAIALMLLGLAGGLVAFYLWRGSFRSLLPGLGQVARRWRKATPLVVVATAPPEEAIPTTPADGTGQASR